MYRNSNGDSQPTNQFALGSPPTGLQAGIPLSHPQQASSFPQRSAMVQGGKPKIIVGNPRVKALNQGSQMSKNIGQNILQKTVKNISSGAAIQRQGSFTGTLPGGQQQPVHGLANMQSGSQSTQHFGQFQTFKLKNTGLSKYQRQFQGSQGNPPASSSTNSQQTKIVIQSQHGRNLKRQALGSGGAQLRGPASIQFNAAGQQQSQLKQLHLTQQHPMRVPVPHPHPPPQMMTVPSQGQHVREMRGANPQKASSMAPPQQTVIAAKQNKLNKLQKQQNIHNIGGDHMSENGSNSVGLDQDEDIPETLSDENNGMYLQMNMKDIRDSSGKQVKESGTSSDQRHSRTAIKNQTNNFQRGRFLSPTNAPKLADLAADESNQMKHAYLSPQNQLQQRPLQYQAFQSATQNEEDPDVLKNECESMHKLIKELNEQAMDMLYSSNQKNVSLDGGPGSAQEYLVIQRKLSEIKQSALNEPESRGRNGKEEDQECSDLQKSLRTLEKALKILTIQHQKQRILVKPIYISIITYNIACCHQQTNNLKKCDKLLAQSIKLLEEDIEFIDRILNEASARGEEQRKSNIEKKKKVQRIEERLRTAKKYTELDAGDNPNYNCRLCLVMLPQCHAPCPCMFSRQASQATVLTPQPIVVPCSLLYLKYTRLRQLTILLLQHCAILSQLNRHADALAYAHNTTKVLHRVSQLAIRIVVAREKNERELERVDGEKDHVREVTEEWLQLHKQLRAANDSQSVPSEKARSSGSQSSQKKERRGRNGRKPSVQLNSANKLIANSSDTRSVIKRKKNSATGIYLPLQTDQKKGEKYPRSRSQHSRRSMSKYSDNSGRSNSRPRSVARSQASSSALSQCLSNVSRKQKKNIKQINAGLERLHTFGMSTVHKGILEQQEQSNPEKSQDQNEDVQGTQADQNNEDAENQKKTIQKTMSQKKLQNAQASEDKKSSDNSAQQRPPGPSQRRKSSVAPMTSLKFLDPKEIQNNDVIDNMSKVSEFSADEPDLVDNKVATMAQRRALAQSAISSSLQIGEAGESLLRHDDGSGKFLSQSLDFEKDGAKNSDLKGTNQTHEDLKLPDVNSEANSSCAPNDKLKRDKDKHVVQNSKFSYYVRDQFQPLQKQKDNIEKLLKQFSEQQKEFLDTIFQSSSIQDLNSSEGFDPVRGYDSGASGSMPRNLQKQSSFSPLVIKNLKLSFQSIEEIERLKRDFNMYRQTQRNQLGISKPTKLPGETGSRRSTRLNWIDLFNIGNVMLMRGQDIQVSHKGWNEICEHDSFEQIMESEVPKTPQPLMNKANLKNRLNQKDSRNQESISSRGSSVNIKLPDSNRLSQHEPLEDQPELSLQRCHKYSISKDSFTEIVLLTVISYFCVSTEHRFINMNQDREKQQAPLENATGGSMLDLNNSNQSMPSTIRSAGIQGSGLNSTLHRSTKDRTQTSSTQRQLAAKNQRVNDGNKSVQNTNFHSSNFNSNSSTGNQKHIQSLQEKGTGLQVHHHSQENNTAMLSNIENRGSHSETNNSQVDHQEYFLCKALHFGLLYLPPDSPLVQHLTQNYIKNYLQPRLQKREDLVQKFMQ